MDRSSVAGLGLCTPIARGNKTFLPEDIPIVLWEHFLLPANNIFLNAKNMIKKVGHVYIYSCLNVICKCLGGMPKHFDLHKESKLEIFLAVLNYLIIIFINGTLLFRSIVICLICFEFSVHPMSKCSLEPRCHALALPAKNTSLSPR